MTLPAQRRRKGAVLTALRKPQGHPGPTLAPVLRISSHPVCQAVTRGRAGAAAWHRLLTAELDMLGKPRLIPQLFQGITSLCVPSHLPER